MGGVCAGEVGSNNYYMVRFFLFINVILFDFILNAQNPQWNLVNSENLNTEIKYGRIDYGNSIVELTTGVGTYYFDLRSGRLLTKFGGKNWSDGFSKFCDSLKLPNSNNYSRDSLILIDSTGKIEANNRTINFIPINRGLNPMNVDLGEFDLNLEVNCENKWQPWFIKCDLKNPLHLLIRKFWLEIKNRDVQNNLSSFNLESINDCEFNIRSNSFKFITSEHIKVDVLDSENNYSRIIDKYKNLRNSEFICFDDLYSSDGIVLYSLGRDLSISSLLQFSEEYNSLYFNDGFFLVSPDSSRLLYRSKSHDIALRGYMPFILFNIKNYEIIQILDGEACNLFGYAFNETSFSEQVISFSLDSKYVLVGNRLFNAYDGSEVIEYYDWICKNDLDSMIVKSGQSETSCYNFGAYFSFFSDTSNICLIYGEKLNSFNLNSMTGSTWHSAEEDSFRYQDSLQLQLNEIDISEYLEFCRQGELDELNAEKVDLIFSDDSLNINWDSGLYSFDILNFYITQLDSNFYSELIEYESEELKEQLLDPIFFERYFVNFRKEIKNQFHLYRLNKFFILIVQKSGHFDLFFHYCPIKIQISPNKYLNH
jgi:hypothetical protein